MRPRTENAKGTRFLWRRASHPPQTTIRTAEAVRALRHALAKHRRSLATGLQRLGVRLEVTEAVLNHLSGSRAGVVGIYQRQMGEEKRAALDAAVKILRSRTSFGTKGLPLRGQSGFLQVIRIP